MKVQVSELIVKYMERLGIDTIFGMPAAGHEGGPLFMFGEHGFDGRVIETVINRQYMRARHTKDGIYTEAFHIFDN